MKILMLAPRFPYPPTRGDCVRAWGQLDYLARRHELWLACLNHRPPDAAHERVVRARCRDVYIAVRSNALALLRGGAALLRGAAITRGYFSDRRLRHVLAQWSAAHEFDAVLTFSSAMAPYAGKARARRRVLDMNDVDSFKWRVFARRGAPLLRGVYALEAERMARNEARWMARHDVCVLVNERERKRLSSLRPVCATDVVRTGLRLDALDKVPRTPPPEPNVVTIGSLSYGPNVRAARWFGQHAWPLVRRAVPAAQWDIVGREPSRAVRRLARLPGVRVTGFVPDVLPYLCRARVVVNSTLDEIGVQTKLIEALAAGKPAVVTPQAAAGMAYDAPPPFLVSGSPCGFADAVVRLLRDDALAARLGARAREVAAASYDVDVEGARLEQWLIGDPAAPPKPARPDRQRASAPQRKRKPLAIGGAR